jgi:Transposase IS4
LENRYLKLFVPGQQLSLDETLIRAFGRIKFKVRIVTKAARYGIKIYVNTDAATAFVLRVVFYTGKTTYYIDLDSLQDRLKTVQVVNHLVEPFVGTHRTI